MTKCPLYLFAEVVLLAGTALLVATKTVDDPVKQVLAAGNREVPLPDSLPRWWAETMQCLGERARPVPEGLRFFEGPTIPRGWSCPSGKSYLGCTNGRVVLFGQNYSTHRDVVDHELWHVRHGGGHPDDIFNPPKCGMVKP